MQTLRGMRTRSVLLLAAATLLMAFNLDAAALPGFVQTAQSEHFDFFTRESRDVEPRKLEACLGRFEHTLGVRVPGRIAYYRYLSPEQVQVATGMWAAGVAFAAERTIYSTMAFQPHEVVHLVAGQLGDPGRFFQEGLAVALGDDGRWNGKSADAGARAALHGHPLLVSEILSRQDGMETGSLYPLAGSFVGYLLKTYGAPAVSAFFRGTAGDGVPVAFERSFGTTLDAAGEQWMARL